jgi:hypothetical protein
MNILVKALLSFTLTVIFTSSAYAQKNSINWCKSFTQQKVTHAIFLDEKGNPITGALDLGQVSAEGDFETKNKFYLILFPKRLTPEDLGSQVMNDELKKIKSRCPSTSEYMMLIGINSPKMKSGKINSSIRIRILDPNSDDVCEPIEVLEKDVTGTLFKPQVEVMNTKKLETNINNLYSNNKPVEITFINTGNRPASMKGWQEYDAKLPQEIQLQDVSCTNTQLQPQETCSINLVKTSQEKPKYGIYQWVIGGSFSLFIEKLSDGKVKAYTEN